MKKTLYRAAAATVLGLSLTTGIAAAQSINNGNGVDSWNTVRSSVHNDQYTHLNNNLGVHNATWQASQTGDATSAKNTTSGGASTGAATNSTSFAVAANVNNSAASSSAWMAGAGAGSTSGSISNGNGADSSNLVSSRVENKVVTNVDNNICVTNETNQTSVSGDAKVYENTTAGSATTGAASNTSNTTVTLNVTN